MVASATTSAPATSALDMSAMTPALVVGNPGIVLNSTSAPLICHDTSLAKGAAQSADSEAPALKKRKVAAPAVVSESISDK
jgi:hypothetical protein